MTRRLTIRRVSSILPTFLLIGLTAVALLVGWLTLFGLPQSTLRYIEQQAALQGIHLRVSQVKLSPSAGLALRASDVRLYASADTSQQPIFQASEVMASLRLSRLILGELVLARMQVTDGNINLPVNREGAPVLPLSNLNADAIFRNSNQCFDLEAQMHLMGIPLSLTYACAAAPPTETEEMLTTGEDTQPLQLESLLSPIQPYIDRAYGIILSQHWKEGDLPSIQLQLQQHPDYTEAALVATVPRYEAHGFHFRDGRLSAQFEGKVLTINEARFITVEPDSEVSLKAAYSLEENRVSFVLASSAALVPMAKSLLHTPPPILELFGHSDGHAPSISLSGDLHFTPDYSLEHAQIQGTFDQEQLQIGSRQVDTLSISFSYDDGNFNIDNLELEYAGGHLEAQAQARDGSGEISIRGDIPVQETLALVSQFTPEPVILPEGIQLGHTVSLELGAKLSVAFRKGELLTLQNTVPTLENCHLTLGTPTLSYGSDISIQKPQLHLKVEGLEHTGQNLPFRAKSIQVKAEMASASITASENQPPLELSQITFRSNAKDLQINPETWQAESVSAQAANIMASCQSFSFGEINGDHISIQGNDLGFLMKLDAQNHFNITTNILTNVKRLRFRDTTAYNAGVLIIPTSLHHGMLRVDVKPSDQSQTDASEAGAPPSAEGSFSCSYSIDPGQSLKIDQIEAHLPLREYEPLLGACGLQFDEFQIPGQVNLSGEALINLEAGTLTQAKVSLEIPELLRTPCATKALLGKDERISIRTQAQLSTQQDTGTLAYSGDLTITHESGQFTGNYVGDSAGTIRIQGNSDIDLMVLDHLIDNRDAHSIIRDFNEKENTRTHISNIDVSVDYQRGLKLRSDCDVLLENIGYQLDAYSEQHDNQGQATGIEILRKDMGSDPFVRTEKATCHVTTNVNLDQVNDAGDPLPDEITVDILHPEIIYDNRGWIRRHKLAHGTPRTSLKGDRILLDLMKETVQLYNVRGDIYPAYSLGMFFDDLHGFLSDARITYPVMTETAYCRFPISSTCKESMTGVIGCQSPTTVNYTFAGVVFPLEDFSGFIRISDDYVTLDKMNAQCWDGVLNAMIRFGISSRRTTLDGYVQANNMNLRKIARALDSDQNYALCDGEIRFQSKSPDVQDLQAYGYANITSGDLMNLRIFQPVGEFITDLPYYLGILSKKASSGSSERIAGGNRGKPIKQLTDSTTSVIPFANYVVKHSLTEAKTKFDIIGGHLYTREATASGVNLAVQMSIDVNLVDMTLTGDMWPNVYSVVALAVTPLTFLSDFMIDIKLHGPLDNISWSIGLDKKFGSSHDTPQASAPPQPTPAARTKRKKSKAKASR